MGASGVTPDMVRMFYKTQLSDEALELAIEAAEADLANHIGPLSGAITQTFLQADIFQAVLARRPQTDTMVLTSGANVVPPADYTSGNDARVVRNLTNLGWAGLTVGYEPDDLAQVQMAVIDLVMLQATVTAAGGFKRERLGEYQYEMWGTGEAWATRSAILRRFRYTGWGSAYTTKLIPIGASDP